jgi:hypothetical protein
VLAAARSVLAKVADAGVSQANHLIGIDPQRVAMIAAAAQHALDVEKAPIDDLGDTEERAEGGQRPDRELGEVRGDLLLGG